MFDHAVSTLLPLFPIFENLNYRQSLLLFVFSFSVTIACTHALTLASAVLSIVVRLVSSSTATTIATNKDGTLGRYH